MKQFYDSDIPSAPKTKSPTLVNLVSTLFGGTVCYILLTYVFRARADGIWPYLGLVVLAIAITTLLAILIRYFWERFNKL